MPHNTVNPILPPLYIPGATAAVSLTSATAMTNFSAPTTTAGLGCRFVRIEARSQDVVARIGTYDGTDYDWAGYTGLNPGACLFIPAGSVGVFRLPDRKVDGTTRGAVGLAAGVSTATAQIHWGT
jgi:hypothetical protein